MLTSNFESPLVSQTSVGSHLEESFNIFSQLGFQHVGGHLQIFSFLVVTNSVEEPTGDTVSFGIVDKICNSITLFFIKLASPDAGIDPEDFADEEAKPAADTLDLLQCEGHSPLAIDVGVEDTVDVLKVSICVLYH